jgi:antitoxin (DNA-binding transcriptional repressor) of toxin-antitoxin stability system
MEQFTVEQFQERFDELLDRVENGETFQISNGENVIMITPYRIIEDIDEIVRIHTDHEEGS